MADYVSIKNKDDEYYRVEVPHDVYIYIKQLESAVGYSDVSLLKTLYPERFGEPYDMI